MVVISPSHRRRGATADFGENRHHRSDTARIFDSFPYPSQPSTAAEPPRDRRRVASLLFRDCTAVLYTVTPEAPLRFLIKTATTVVTPPVHFNSFPLPVTHLTAVEPPRDSRRVASLHFRDCTAVVLRRHGGDEGATAGHVGDEGATAGHVGDGGADAVLVRRHGGHGGDAATRLRIGPTRGGTVEVLNMFKVSAVPPRRSAVLTVFGGATAINDGTTAEPRRSRLCHCG